MSGFNGCLMAYGQTSAGKSWTMEGPSLWDTEYQGAIPRCVDGLFNAIDEADEDIEFQVTVSYFEIYCEKVRDLLNPSMCNLKVRETRADGFIVQDVTEVFCTDRENVLRVIELGKANRASAPTLMNAESSRSHSIVTMVVEQKDSSTGRKKRGMMFLVDLAGSEKVSKTGASGMRLEEAKNINRSLTTLGMVINSLCDGASHVPYRDSSLTLILKDALGGNSKTTLIICCNPESRHTPETLSTLRFGERAKRIKNNARINEEYSVDELKVMLQAARKEIEQLKKKLALYTGGGDPASPRSSQSMLKRSFSSGAMLTSGNSIEYVGSSNYEDALTSGVDQVQRDIDNLGGSVDFEDEELLTKMTELQEAKRQKEEEIVDLRARITSLEEELDDERIRLIESVKSKLIRKRFCS